MEPFIISYITDRINWLIGRFSQREDDRIRERKEVIDALLDALQETRIHFGNQRLVRNRDREAEARLSRLWSTAARKVEPFDSDLANRCETKGTYWADPVDWRDDDLLAAGITIKEIEISLKKLKKSLTKRRSQLR